MNNQSRVYEYFAKLVLEEYFCDKIVPLQVKDKPDLQSENQELGIEVVCAIDDMENEATYLKIVTGEIKDEEKLNKTKEELARKGMYICEEGFAVSQADCYGTKVEGTPLSGIVNAVEKKVKKLNDGYAYFEKYGLFIYTKMWIDYFNQDDLFNCICKIDQGLKKYSDIYIIALSRIYLFDMVKNTMVGLELPCELHNELMRKAEALAEENIKRE